jgi:hypothetical protein
MKHESFGGAASTKFVQGYLDVLQHRRHSEDLSPEGHPQAPSHPPADAIVDGR